MVVLGHAPIITDLRSHPHTDLQNLLPLSPEIVILCCAGSGDTHEAQVWTRHFRCCRPALETCQLKEQVPFIADGAETGYGKHHTRSRPGRQQAALLEKQPPSTAVPAAGRARAASLWGPRPPAGSGCSPCEPPPRPPFRAPCSEGQAVTSEASFSIRRCPSFTVGRLLTALACPSHRNSGSPVGLFTFKPPLL